MRHMEKSKARAREMEEMLSLKANQGVPHQEGLPHLEREIEQMRKVMDEIRENMRRANPVEDLVHRIDFPFTDRKSVV